MVTLVSPGVDVSVIDESAYASPGSGTTPLIIIATASNKADPTGTYSDGIARYTKPELAGTRVLVTSQRELTQFFGNPEFSTEEGDETNEYGLLTAYSYLGQGSRIFVVRADVDLGQLSATDEPTNEDSAPPDGTYWVDTSAGHSLTSIWGLREWDNTNNYWEPVPQSRIQINQLAVDAAFAAPSTTTFTPTDGNYLIQIKRTTGSDIELKFYKGDGSSWDELITTAGATKIQVVDTVQGIGDGANAGETALIRQELEYARNALYILNSFGDFSINLASGAGTTFGFLSYSDSPTITGSANVVELVNNSGASKKSITNAESYLFQDDEPTAAAIPDGTLWFDGDNVTDLDIFLRVATGWSRVADSAITYAPEAPATATNDNIWVDTSANASEYPKLYRGDGTNWIAHDNTDQAATSDTGVVFAEITGVSRATLASGVPTTAQLYSDAPNHTGYSPDMLAVNMGLSGNTLKKYDADRSGWVNAITNAADGSGVFGKRAQHKTISEAMQGAVAGNDELRDPFSLFTLMVAPNFPELTDELVTLNSDRGETGFTIIDTPMTLSPTEAINWVGNVNASENGIEGLLTKNEYSGVYYPAVRTTTPDGQTVTVPPSHAVLYSYAYSDNVSYPWFAPAGLTRGRLRNASGVGYITSGNEFKPLSLNQGQRDSMYLKDLNPIANFPDTGPVIFGQKSLSGIDSALDRVNVARMVVYVRERFEQMARAFLFGQNDSITRARATSVYESFLADLMTKRGIDDFAVVCDDSNNPQSVINRNEMFIDVALLPTKSVEFIFIPVRLVNEL